MRDSHYSLLVYDTEGRLYDVRHYICSKKEALRYCVDTLDDVFYPYDHVPYLVELRVRSKSKHFPNGSRLVGLYRWCGGQDLDGIEDIRNV